MKHLGTDEVYVFHDIKAFTCPLHIQLVSRKTFYLYTGIENYQNWRRMKTKISEGEPNEGEHNTETMSKERSKKLRTKECITLDNKVLDG